MWNTMLLSHITSLFVLLSAAAPVTENPALSHTLAKRSTHCTTDLGYSISPTDCYEAHQNMLELPQFKPDRANGIFATRQSEFSRTAVDSRLRLPQAFTVRGCTILVDVARGRSSVRVTRSSVPTGALRIINQCVRGFLRTGGSDTGSSIDTVIANKQSLSVEMRRGWEQCIALVQGNTPFDEHAQCLLHEFEVDAEAQARERAGMPGNHATSKR